MRYIFLLAMFFMFIGALAAQDFSISGKVVDKNTSLPLPGVSVFVPELNRGVVTDLDGIFKIAGIPEKNIKLQISFLGYATIVKTLKANADKDLLFEMEEYATTIDEVVVSGAYIMSKESSPISIEKVDRVDLLKMPAPNLMSALARTPGVSEISLGPGISKPVIRGLSFSRVLSLYQGARFENQQWGADHGLGMTETGIANIEMIKGPASIIYGSGAMAGVVNLIEERDAQAGEIEGDVNLRGFSNSLGGRSEVGVKGASENGFVWSLRGAAESHADYLDGDGNTVGNTRFNTQNVKAGVGLQKKWGDTRIRYTYLKQRLGILEEDELDELVTTRNDRAMQLPFQDVRDHFFNSETNVFIGEDRLKATFGYHMNLRKEIEDDFDEVDLGLRQSNFMYDIKYYKTITEHVEAIFGVQGFYLQNTNMEEAEEILIPDASKDDRSVYALLNYNKDKWVIQGGLRYDYRKVIADASAPNLVDYGFVLPGEPADRRLERTFDGVTASGGATFRPDNHWRFRLNVAQGFRAPDLAELFSNGPHPGTSRFERGDASFVREQNVQTDFGIRYTNNGFSISGEIFYNHIDNYIFFSPTNEMVEDLTVWVFEQADARLYGGELELGYQPNAAKWVNFGSSYSRVIGQRRSDDTFLPYIPAFQWAQNVDFRLKNIGRIQRPYISLLGSFVFDQNRAAPLEEATPGYYLLGLNIGGNIQVANNVLDVYVSGTNLLNQTYLDHMSLFRPFGINQLGRNIALNVRIPF
ncbi:TonB-dependent receptor [Cecembia lonarensis]|uniref:Putative TonB-dependent receptor n=1 Tax=Cecembia lonarensis (strain CCUG 58316 / KCTC 22772 / LW9) TaxID=1225176 RepID=K1L2S2_CECL9|nr:TonB-dependent receptor [Cecembia lonarensis]EKB49111.1 putative TonB-dependent receptor precursor [Cecembia lonarensis LW9]